MNLNEYCEFKHISPSGYTDESIDRAIKEVNQLIEDGWHLVETFKTCYDEIFPDMQTLHFVLAYPANRKAFEEISGKPYDDLMGEAISSLKTCPESLNDQE